MIKPRCKVPKTEAAEPSSAKWRCRTKKEFCKRETGTRALHAARANLLSISLLIAP
jgi:hypothetical protein